MHKHTNRLIKETSPYLLQHAHNPVDWFAWGDEAFDIARQQDKPVLVSIGYSACHWCHVMERESFENEDTARYMNEHFINIKIDREERPDIDHIYMDAVQAMTGSGGWPLNVFLLPDGRPFFGGTYFPPKRAFNRGSWLETLQAVSQAFEERRNELETQAENLTQHIGAAGTMGVVADVNSSDWFDENTQPAVTQNLLKQGDRTWGGFGRAPKFPQTFAIIFLLRHYHFTADKNALDQALLSLDKMMYGGIYDQLGGGFARYSTDEQWLAPHFEKMLYDNALLMNCYAEAYQLTRKPAYAETIRQTLDFVRRELMSDEGGFFSALDADSEGVEGKFYTWSKEEIDSVLGEDSPLFCDYYGIEPGGNWEHTNILWVQQPEDMFVNRIRETDTSVNAVSISQTLEQCRRKLFEVRAQRTRPGLDDKILLSWNALMNIAFCKAYAALQQEEYRDSAVANMRFLESRFFDASTDKWLHTYKDNVAKYPAFLDDLSYLALAYIHLQEVTGDAAYLLKAKEITNLLINGYKDADEPYFYFTSKYQQDVIVRKKEMYDGATPSGNAVMAYVLLYLAKIFDEASWYDMAIGMLKGVEQAVVKYPTSFGFWASALQFAIRQVNEIAIVGEDASRYLPVVLSEYIPDKVIQSSAAPDSRFPLLAGKRVQKETLFFLCKNYACLQPVFTPANLIAMINKQDV